MRNCKTKSMRTCPYNRSGSGRRGVLFNQTSAVLPKTSSYSTVVVESDIHQCTSGDVFTKIRFVSTPQSTEAVNLMQMSFNQRKKTQISRETLGEVRQKLIDEKNAAYKAVEQNYNRMLAYHNQNTGRNDPESQHQLTLLNFAYEAAKEKAKNASERLKELSDKLGKSKEEIFEECQRTYDEYLEYYKHHQSQMSNADVRQILQNMLDVREKALSELKIRDPNPANFTSTTGHLSSLKQIYERADEAYMKFYNSNIDRLADPAVKRKLKQLESLKNQTLAKFRAQNRSQSNHQRQAVPVELYREFENALTQYNDFYNSNVRCLNHPEVQKILKQLQTKKDLLYDRLQRYLSPTARRNFTSKIPVNHSYQTTPWRPYTIRPKRLFSRK